LIEYTFVAFVNGARRPYTFSTAQKKLLSQRRNSMMGRGLEKSERVEALRKQID